MLRRAQADLTFELCMMMFLNFRRNCLVITNLLFVLNFGKLSAKNAQTGVCVKNIWMISSEPERPQMNEITTYLKIFFLGRPANALRTRNLSCSSRWSSNGYAFRTPHPPPTQQAGRFEKARNQGGLRHCTGAN